MLSYCWKYRKNREKNQKVVKTKNERIMLLLKCAVFNSKKLTFLKEQVAKQSLGNLTGAKTPLLSDLTILNTLF